MEFAILEIFAIVLVTIYGNFATGNWKNRNYFLALVLAGVILLIANIFQPSPDQSILKNIVIWLLLTIPILISAAVSRWFSKQGDAPIAIYVGPVLVGALSIFPTLFVGILVACHIFGDCL